MFPAGDTADPKAQRGYRGVGTVGVGLFSGTVMTAFSDLSQASEENPRRETAVSDLYIASEAWCSRKETLRARDAKDWCSQKGTLQT